MGKRPSEEAVAAWLALQRNARAVLEAVEGELKRAKLPPLVWYDVLHELSGETSGLRPFELVARMLLPQYSTSRLLARMEKAGLIERLACAEDGRGQVIKITPAGRELRRRVWAVYGPSIRRHLGNKLTKAQSSDLTRLLGKLTQG